VWSLAHPDSAHTAMKSPIVAIHLERCEQSIGFHVSPQPHQDFVGVHIEPKGTPPTGHPDEAIGHYSYKLEPLRWTQAEGTHWYHAHKHGSTSLQVLNGLVGVFIIDGPFDKWLNRFYRHDKLREKQIVIQQIRDRRGGGDAQTKPRMRFTLLENDSQVAHPFHIHVNPFQVIEDGGIKYSPPYVWQDTIAIPVGTPENKGAVVINQRFLDFTGGHVQHCHILGHEDRGMMVGVQNVCPNGQYGRATSGQSGECRPGNYIPALPQCEVPPP
jgi:hypothetical protein